MNEPYREIIKYIESIPYGHITLTVEKQNRKVSSVTTLGEETIRYVDNEEARKDLDSMVRSMIEAGYTGEVNVKLSMKDGNVQIVSIFNRKETDYKKR